MNWRAIKVFVFWVAPILFICCYSIAMVVNGRAKAATGHRAKSAATAIGSPATREQPPADEHSGAGVHTAMKNVDFHLTDRIIVHVNALDGTLTPTQAGATPVMDDKQSFQFDVDSADLTLSTAALSNDLNDYVFADSGAPLKKLSASIKSDHKGHDRDKGDQLVVKGLLAKKGGIPFETAGTVALTPEGMVRIHTDKVKAVGIPVKGLMELLGVETDDLISTKKVPGVSVDKDDLILDPQRILPPPRIRGKLTEIRIVNGELAMKFGPSKSEESGKSKDAKAANESSAEALNSCGGRNYLTFRGGSLRFGKLTMSDADLELVDAQPGDPFDFSLDHYKQQLVAGYSKTTNRDGLCVHIPDFDKLKRNSSAAAQ